MADICTRCKMTGKRRDAKRTEEYCEACFEPFCSDHGVTAEGHAFCDICAKMHPRALQRPE